MKADRKRTDVTGDKKVNFRIISPDSVVPDIDAVTSVSVIAFNKYGNIVVSIQKRGPDIPGGHMQEGEVSYLETAEREAMEEAFITIKDTKVACFIESDYYGTEPENLTYMVVLSASINELLEFVPDETSTGREIMTPDKFLEKYTAGDRNFMRQILAFAMHSHGIQKKLGLAQYNNDMK
jgi:8-oxo-dGTP diphosphatase